MSMNMNDDKQPETRLPKIGEFVKGLGTVVEIRDVTPPPPPPPKAEHYVFSAAVYYCELRANGKCIVNYATHPDKEFIKKAARRHAEEVGPSDMVFVVVQSTRHEIKAAGRGRHHEDVEFCRFGDPKGHHTVPNDIDKDVWECWTSTEGLVENDLMQEEA